MNKDLKWALNLARNSSNCRWEDLGGEVQSKKRCGAKNESWQVVRNESDGRVGSDVQFSFVQFCLGMYVCWGSTLVAQQWRICLPVKESQIWILGLEDPWRRKWESTPVFLPEKFNGERSLVGYDPWGWQELNTT